MGNQLSVGIIKYGEESAYINMLLPVPNWAGYLWWGLWAGKGLMFNLVTTQSPTFPQGGFLHPDENILPLVFLTAQSVKYGQFPCHWAIRLLIYHETKVRSIRTRTLVVQWLKNSKMQPLGAYFRSEQHISTSWTLRNISVVDTLDQL